MKAKYESVADAIDAIKSEFLCADVFLNEKGEAMIDLGLEIVFVRTNGEVIMSELDWSSLEREEN